MQRLSKEREATLPYILKEGYEVKSKETELYNCIAFVADDEWRHWWPNDDGYWPIRPPENTPHDDTIDGFVAAFQTIGYKTCDDQNLEDGYTKIAIYVFDGKPAHAAKQLPDGRWKSKLGPWEDIEHNTLRAVEDDFLYGSAVVFMRRETNYSEYADVSKI